ncbi:hypothetical protein BJY52DRAFT_1230442 [Lactarius psammicola]|nr:hypothetical protein BJY52DRAFT_1230442 [Lactarius psammicola]
MGKPQYLPPLPCFRFPGTGLQLTTGLTSSIGEGATCELPNGRGGSPSNTLGTRGTETGSPELSAAWRVLAAQGPMGQERRWAEEKARRASCQMAEGAVPLTPSERAAQRPAPLSFQRPGGCSQLRGLWARRDTGRRWWKHWTKRDQAKVMVDMGVAGRSTQAQRVPVRSTAELATVLEDTFATVRCFFALPIPCATSKPPKVSPSYHYK